MHPLHSPSDRHRILIVDDIEDNILFLKAFLEARGYVVDVAGSANAALEKMYSALPDLVLLDVMMPEMDGYGLTRRIRQDDNLQAIPVVLITAHSDMCRIKGLAVGATDFLRKPIDFELLLQTLQNVLTARTKQRKGSELV